MIRAWHGRVKGLEEIVTVWEPTAGKAKASLLAKAREAGYRVRLPDVRVRVGQGFVGMWWEERPRRTGNAARQPSSLKTGITP
jgi:hypothetical protein